MRTLQCPSSEVASCGLRFPSMDEIITSYFTIGFSYKTILQLLAKYHDIYISLRTLQQRLCNLGLKRRNIEYDRNEVRQAILDHCDGSGSCRGYRSVWHTLQLQGICVPRRVVAEILREVDPEGVVKRRAKKLRRSKYGNPGPNLTIHIFDLNIPRFIYSFICCDHAVIL